MLERLHTRWTYFWMRFAGLSRTGRMATRLATWFAPPYKARSYLAWMSDRGYVSPSATIYNPDFRMGAHTFIGDRVMIYRGEEGGPVVIGDEVCLWGDILVETGRGASVTVGKRSRIHRGCQLIAYLAPIQIGIDVGISQNCAFYSYNHGFAAGMPISAQPVQTRGPIVVDDHAWLGVGVIVLDGVRIGKGAVIGAGAVVTRDIPDGAIACGVPARVIANRAEISQRPVASS